MICPKCGNDNKNTATFCMSCGTSLIQRKSVFHAKSSGDIGPARKMTRRIDSASQTDKEATFPESGSSRLKSIPDSLRQGRYEIVRQLGAGGMGRVFLADDTLMNFPVVVKEMLPLVITQNEKKYMEDRFKEEAQLLFRLKHQGLPKVMEYFTENESLFLIMEYVKGENLEEAAKKRPGGRISMDECLNWMGKILNVLKYLHSQDPPIIHRDIKPANIMLGDDGEVMLVDFGVARALAATTSTRVGTPGFASIDHFTGKFCPASDIFSLGATFHYLLSADDPRDRGDFLFPALSRYRKDVPDGFQRILDKSVEMKKEDRYQTVDEMLMALDSFKRDYSRGIHGVERPVAKSHPRNVAASPVQSQTSTFQEGKGDTLQMEGKSVGRPSVPSSSRPVTEEIPGGKADSTLKIKSKSTASLPSDEFSQKDTGKKNSLPVFIAVGAILLLVIFTTFFLLFIGAARKARFKKRSMAISAVVKPGEVVFDLNLKNAELKVYHSDGQFCGLWKLKDGKLAVIKSNKNEKLSPPDIKVSASSDKISLNPGEYIIRISKPGHFEFVKGKSKGGKGVKVESGKQVDVNGKWVPFPSILVTINQDAKIFLDGKEVGRTSNKKFEIKGLREGVTYKVMAKRGGYYNKEKKVKITKRRGITRRFLTLDKIPAQTQPSRPSYSPSTYRRVKPVRRQPVIRKPLGDDI
ncbi:MAG: protein kinase [Candidatus Eremiobacteraeota bacterium]|nr:protein kinase [Candidatus Eremiobacteraeota bacterium]